MKKHDKELTPAELARLSDSEINFSDIPELDQSFWKQAKLIRPDRTEQVTLRVKHSVLDFFKTSGKGWQTRMNRALESYVHFHTHHEDSGRPAPDNKGESRHAGRR
jgi:uncharacterized protein (DUF4415 family)